MTTYQHIPTHVNLPSSTYLPLPIPKYQYIIAADPGAGISLVILKISDGYIMSEQEVKFKTQMWEKVNADYLKELAEKEERERKEREEGKESKGKRKKTEKKQKTGRSGGPNQTAIEAIEKIVQEKKISTKINYDVLRSLSFPEGTKSGQDDQEDQPVSLL